jgi:CspA family cold shock protein
MATGTVKWFSASKHYGFITPDAGGQDVFVHKSVLVASNLAALADGARVSFDVAQDGQRTSASNLALLETQSTD